MSEARIVHARDDVLGAVYIGRAAPRAKLKASLFASPYAIGASGKQLTRGDALALYEFYLWLSGLLLPQLPELRGKPLACWCRHDGETEPRCHGDILLAILDRFTDDELRSAADWVTRADLNHRWWEWKRKEGIR